MRILALLISVVLFYRCVVDVDFSYALFRSTTDAGLPEDILLAIPRIGFKKKDSPLSLSLLTVGNGYEHRECSRIEGAGR